jgi:(p)ppGpp synthase/HD superfamily hydrolase
MGLINKAIAYAAKQHDGQYRKKSNIPYIVHPIRVAKLASNFGYNDSLTQTVALLHDTIEDTSSTYEDITDKFGAQVAKGVSYLTDDASRTDYLRKLENSPDYVKIIKLCDTLDNITTLQCLDQKGIERKITECNEFYIPMAEELCPKIAEQIKKYIRGK